MTYIPPHKRPGYVAPSPLPSPVPEGPTTGVLFRSPLRNNTTLHTPNSTKMPRKRTLKAIPKIHSPPNKYVPFTPTSNIKHLPPKFRAYMEAKLEEQRKEAARTRRVRRNHRATAKRAKETRRTKRRGHVKK